MTLTLRPPTPELATPADLPKLLELLTEAVRWLTPRTNQWHDIIEDGEPTARAQRRYTQAIACDTCYVVRIGNEIVATMILDNYADPEFWPQPTAPLEALYVHRLIVKRSAAGQGLGLHMLNWARAVAHRRGKTYVRLDAWSSNERLHRYYLEAGFEQLTTWRLTHRGSGALFQAKAQPINDSRNTTRPNQQA